MGLKGRFQELQLSQCGRAFRSAACMLRCCMSGRVVHRGAPPAPLHRTARQALPASQSNEFPFFRRMAFRLAPSSGRLTTGIAVTVAFAVLLLLAMPMFYFYGDNASSGATMSLLRPSLATEQHKQRPMKFAVYTYSWLSFQNPVSRSVSPLYAPPRRCLKACLRPWGPPRRRPAADAAAAHARFPPRRHCLAALQDTNSITMNTYESGGRLWWVDHLLVSRLYNPDLSIATLVDKAAAVEAHPTVGPALRRADG